jgi:hypothetical protein
MALVRRDEPTIRQLSRQDLFGHPLHRFGLLCTRLTKTVPSLLISCSAEAERSDTTGSFNAFSNALSISLYKSRMYLECRWVC